jgi:hypothetical protein
LLVATQRRIANPTGLARDAKRLGDKPGRSQSGPSVVELAREKLDPQSLLALQRTAGNAAVGTLVARKPAAAPPNAPPKAAQTVAHDPVADQIQHEGNDPSSWTTFESAKQIVSNQFNWLVMQQVPGLNQWQKAAHYREKHIELEILKACAIGVLAAATDGLGVAVAEGVAEVVESRFAWKLTELSKELITEASKESMKTGIDSGIEAYNRSKEENGESAIDEFYHLQYGMVTEMANVTQSKFLGRDSNYYENLHKKNPIRALDLLRGLVVAMRRQQKKAEDLQFEVSVRQWAVAMAQADAGVIKVPAAAGGEPGGMTDMSHEAGSGPSDRWLRGVLYLHAYVNPDKPREPLELDMADMAGMTKPMRRVFQGKTIDEMKVPLTLIIDAVTGSAVTISRNEAGSFFVGRINAGRPAPTMWLRNRFNPPLTIPQAMQGWRAIADAYHASGVMAVDAVTLVTKEIAPFSVDKWGLELRLP